MKQHELDIDSLVFTELRNRLSMTIQDAVKQMKVKNLSEETVTAKIKISVLSSIDENGEIHSSAIFEPKVTAKIGRSEEEKCGATGGRVTIGDDGEVLIGSEQVTMDEVMEGQA